MLLWLFFLRTASWTKLYNYPAIYFCSLSRQDVVQTPSLMYFSWATLFFSFPLHTFWFYFLFCLILFVSLCYSWSVQAWLPGMHHRKEDLCEVSWHVSLPPSFWAEFCREERYTVLRCTKTFGCRAAKLLLKCLFFLNWKRTKLKAAVQYMTLTRASLYAH